MDNFEQELLDKIDNNIKLSEHEIRDLVHEFAQEVQHDDNRRWTRSNKTISRLGDRYFSILWEEGLTEYQENYYPNQPIEVELKTYEKLLTIKEWVKKGE